MILRFYTNINDIANSIIGKLITYEKYKLVDAKIIAAVVLDALDIIRDTIKELEVTNDGTKG